MGFKKTIKAIDLFAGIGGIRKGFDNAFGDKIEFVFSNEIDDFACQTYEKNFGESPKGDITNLDLKSIPKFDLLLAGFPCQSFSIAGEKRGFSDIRGTLFFYIADIIRVHKPKAFLLENVKNLVHHDNGRTFQIIKDVLTEDLGYYIHTNIFNSRDFGVAQNRERIYIVGFNKNLRFEFPKPNHKKKRIKDILQAKAPKKYYLSQQYLNTLKKHRQRHERKGNGYGYIVLSKEDVSNTLVCGGMGHERNLVKDKVPKNHWTKGKSLKLKNYEGIRKMTPREWARLQGYPESFSFPVSDTQAYKQLANSVSVPVITEIAEKIKKSLDNRIIEYEDQFANTKYQKISEFIIKMYQKNQLTKTGYKSKTSILNLVQKWAIRIDSYQDFVQIMVDFGLIEDYDNKVKFAYWILETKSKAELQAQLKDRMAKKVEFKSIVKKYQDLGVIES